MEYEKTVPVPSNMYVRVNHWKLKNFVAEVFEALNVPEKDAEIVSDNLVTADLRGIESHGVARLKRYVDGLVKGVVKARPHIKVLREGKVHALIDGDSGLGQVIGFKAMKLAIEKAKKNFFGVVGVRKSNHYGIAGYYALMALKEDLIGVSLTNSRPLVAHTGALKRTIGTNPIAVAVPTARDPPFVLDMATSIVPIGKIESYRRKGEEFTRGWGIHKNGEITTNPEEIFEGGALVPLGGLGEVLGGHKGYGLSVVVDVFSGILTGANWGAYVGATEGPEPSNVGHFFAAINVEAFISLEEFKEKMERLKFELKNSKLHPSFKKIWIHGEKSWLTMKTRIKKGIPVYRKTMEMMEAVAKEVGVKFPFKV